MSFVLAFNLALSGLFLFLVEMGCCGDYFNFRLFFSLFYCFEDDALLMVAAL
jgi:hypothetical protein